MFNSAKPQTVLFVLYDGVTLFDFAGPAEVLSHANNCTPQPVYDLHYVAANRNRRLRTTTGLEVHATDIAEAPAKPDLLILPGAYEDALMRALDNERLIAWLRKATKKSRRVASVCSGAFFLGRLGLADGRRVTTHWDGLERFAETYPKAKLEQDTLYVNDGDLWSSAGVSSGVDMALAMVARDLGAQTALEVARYMVLFLVRSGGQSQFSRPIDFQLQASQSGLLTLIGLMEEKLDEDLSVDRLAGMAGLSVRTLHRRCRDAFGLTPAKILSELRLERARTLLADRTLPIKSIAARCGFADAATLSKAFTQRFGVAPSSYREGFSHPPTAMTV